MGEWMEHSEEEENVQVASWQQGASVSLPFDRTSFFHFRLWAGKWQDQENSRDTKLGGLLRACATPWNSSFKDPGKTFPPSGKEKTVWWVELERGKRPSEISSLIMNGIKIEPLRRLLRQWLSFQKGKPCQQQEVKTAVNSTEWRVRRFQAT